VSTPDFTTEGEGWVGFAGVMILLVIYGLMAHGGPGAPRRPA
jgi:hypothetical protein